MENNYNQPGNQGNNHPKKNNNIIKLIILVASIVVLLFVACIFLFFTFIMKRVKSDNAALYGNETTESFTEIATEENTEIDTEETTEDASTEETTEEITTTENAVNPDVKTYGSDSLGYLSVPLDLQETDEFGDSFANSSEIKTYKNAEETFVVGLVRYDNSTKSPEDMASELESSLSAQGDTYTTVSDAKIGEYQTIPAKELSFNNADGVYGNFYFFEQDGDLYLIQVIFAFQHVVEAETIVFTYESPK